MGLKEGLNFLKFLNRGGVLVDLKNCHQKWIPRQIPSITTTTKKT